MIRVLLVDDQALVRDGLARILGPDDGFEVVGECSDGDEVPDALARAPADVVLMDLRMRRVDGIAAITRLTAAAHPPAVLVVTTFDEDELLWAAISAGASGFLLKDSSAQALMAATRAVAGGGAWFDPAVTPRVLAAYRSVIEPAARERRRLDQLSPREHDVLALMARGATNGEIASTLHLGETTVKTHVGNIFTKLGVRDRPGAIVYAFDHGVVGPGQ